MSAPEQKLFGAMGLALRGRHLPPPALTKDVLTVTFPEKFQQEVLSKVQGWKGDCV